MKDQLQHWNHAHTEQWLHSHSKQQTKFAEEVNVLIPPHSAVLELGCGEGNDSVYSANQGHEVTATDFSDVVIEQDKKRWSSPQLQFEALDMSKPFEYEDELFNVVYARLSLHYFRDSVTNHLQGNPPCPQAWWSALFYVQRG